MFADEMLCHHMPCQLIAPTPPNTESLTPSILAHQWEPKARKAGDKENSIEIPIYSLPILPHRDTMTDPRESKLAKLVVNYSINCKKGDQVLIQAPVAAEPLALEMYREVLKAGGHPMMIPSFAPAQEIFFEEAKDFQIKYIPDVRMLMYKTFNGLINISADTNTRALSSVPSKKMAMQSAAMADLREIFMTRGA